MKRIFTLVLGALAMVAVALVSAFIAMRLAIHGREAVVPPLVGLSVTDANQLAGSKGLQLVLENRFYSSDVPAGRILAQDPASGLRVRREWPVRITESLGAQSVNIPDLTGESERAATISIQRLSLDLGAVAHLAVSGDPDVVLTQTPPVNSAGVDGPRVSLLVSDPDDVQPQAYVMPLLLGLSYAGAEELAAGAGLRLAVVSVAPPAPVAATMATLPASAPPASASPVSTPPANAQNDAAVHASSSGGTTVLAQTPQAGARVVQGDVVHVTLGHLASSAALQTP